MGRSSYDKRTSTGLTIQAPANCPQLAPDYSGPCHKGHRKCMAAARRLAAARRGADQDG